jgi:hypothetical protein
VGKEVETMVGGGKGGGGEGELIVLYSMVKWQNHKSKRVGKEGEQEGEGEINYPLEPSRAW